MQVSAPAQAFLGRTAAPVKMADVLSSQTQWAEKRTEHVYQGLSKKRPVSAKIYLLGASN